MLCSVLPAPFGDCDGLTKSRSVQNLPEEPVADEEQVEHVLRWLRQLSWSALVWWATALGAAFAWQRTDVTALAEACCYL